MTLYNVVQWTEFLHKNSPKFNMFACETVQRKVHKLQTEVKHQVGLQKELMRRNRKAENDSKKRARLNSFMCT